MLLEKIVKFLYKIGLLKYINPVFGLNCYGKKVRVPIIWSVGLNNFVKKPEWTRYVYELLVHMTPNKVFIDVGANIGQTLLVVKGLCSDLTYIALEPNSSCAMYLNALIRLNHWESNSIVFPIGVFKETGLGILHLYNKTFDDSTASVISEFRPEQQSKGTIRVPLFSGDFVIKHLQNPVCGIIKIDVEGAELDVVQSFGSTIIKDRPFIVIEILPVYNEKNEYRINRQNMILQYIKDNEYDLLRIVKERDGAFCHFNLLAKIETHGDLSLTDYVLCPREKMVEIRQLSKVVK
jgi:FkbM family methyltransferase